MTAKSGVTRLGRKVIGRKVIGRKVIGRKIIKIIGRKVSLD
jgi:hypothetical protein